MNDQAQALRGLMEHRVQPAGRATDNHSPATPVDPRVPRASTLAVTSGKGGVGKSVIALNLAIALARAGQRVSLLDANLGLGSIDLLCGLNGYWNLSHVISGARTLEEITLTGPEGVHVIPGASGVTDVADCPLAAQKDILAQLARLEFNHDFLIIDTATGIYRSVRQFVAAADTVLVVTSTEPTSIADAYATLKSLMSMPEPCTPEILVNQAESAEQAREIVARLQQTAKTFVHSRVTGSGCILRDPAVVESVFRRVPLMVGSPDSTAAQAIDQIARRLISSRVQRQTGQTFFERLQRVA